MARPPKADRADVADVVLTVRLTKAEREALDAKAQAGGTSVAALVRSLAGPATAPSMPTVDADAPWEATALVLEVLAGRRQAMTSAYRRASKCMTAAERAEAFGAEAHRERIGTISSVAGELLADADGWWQDDAAVLAELRRLAGA